MLYPDRPELEIAAVTMFALQTPQHKPYKLLDGRAFPPCSSLFASRRHTSQLLALADSKALQAGLLEPVHQSVTVFSPATVANLGPGFDWLGCAVEVGPRCVAGPLTPTEPRSAL